MPMNGMMIPPSLLMIIYGVLAEQSIGKLFIAGVIPGFLLAVVFVLMIVLMATFTPGKVFDLQRRQALALERSTGPLLTRFKLVKQLEARVGVGVPRCKAAATALSFDRVWNDAAMRWRTASPERTYSARDAGRGSVVTAPSGMPGLDAVIYDGRERWPSERLGASSAPLRLWIGLDPDIDWARSSYVSIPRRLRASPLNLVFRDLTGGSYVPDPERVEEPRL